MVVEPGPYENGRLTSADTASAPRDDLVGIDPSRAGEDSPLAVLVRSFLLTCVATGVAAVGFRWLGRPLSPVTLLVATTSFTTGRTLETLFRSRTSWRWRGEILAWTIAAAVALLTAMIAEVR